MLPSLDHYKYSRFVFAAEVSGYGDTGTYAMLALAHAALAIPVLFFPNQTADYLFGPGGYPSMDIYKPLCRLLGVNLLSAAAKAWLLKVTHCGLWIARPLLHAPSTTSPSLNLLSPK